MMNIDITFPLCVQTLSPTETEEVGTALANAMTADKTLPRFVALYGDLGVGKTAFTRGFASVLSPESLVRSPTFTLVNEYRNKATKTSLFHFDMYRLESEDALFDIGWDDYLLRGGVCAVEWSENVCDALPEDTVFVTISRHETQDDWRYITITGGSE